MRDPVFLVQGDQGTVRLDGKFEEAEEFVLPEEIGLFLKFVRENRQAIDEAVLSGRKMEDIFYTNFYSHDKDDQKYREGTRETDLVKMKYSDEYFRVQEELEAQIEKDEQSGKKPTLKIRGGSKSHWLQVGVNGGVDVKNDTLGRLYFNCDVERSPDFFKQFVEACEKAGIRMELKITKGADAYSFNRFDKLVVYFNADEESEILRITEELHSRNKEIFNDGNIPRFSAQVKDAQGTALKGVGFGEEPTVYGDSFGGIRAEMLKDLVIEGQRYGTDILDPNLDVKKAFKKVCEKHGIDHKNPAFNKARKNGKDFWAIKKGLGVTNNEEKNKKVPVFSGADWKKFFGQGLKKNDPESLAWLSRKGIKINSGDIEVEIDGERLVMTTDEDDFGTTVMRPDTRR